MIQKVNITKLVLVRHGESQWNKENRFTGWIDVGLSSHGKQEAQRAGEILKKEGFFFDFCHTSVLKRAIHTLWIIMYQLDQTWLPVQKTWRLNERHYGALQGINKQDVIKQYGIKQVEQWRRGLSSIPPKTDIDELLSLRKDPRYINLNIKELPSAESLLLTLNRILPYWNQNILPHIKNHKKLIISAHGNTIRAIMKFLNNFNEEEVFHFNVPTGIPLICEFNQEAHYMKYYYLR